MMEPLSDTESKVFSSRVLDDTGLVIGAKSLKNYSSYILKPKGKKENPSMATLDTLARFVMDAPYTDEVERKGKEAHYPYWFQYKNNMLTSRQPANVKFSPLLVLAAIALVVAVLFLLLKKSPQEAPFSDDFHSLAQDSMNSRGWFVQSIDTGYWQKRSKYRGYFTLYTLKGDNWPDSLHRPEIKNLLLRKILSNCFTAEVHLSEFSPEQNWQQAGILLLEDTNFSGKALRLSLCYNDFYGGFPRAREIILQAIVSPGKQSDKPEEIAHQLVFKLDSTDRAIVDQNLQHSALRIEKHGQTIRLLFANGSMPNSAFKEIVDRELDIKPRFIGLFALHGFVDSASAIPAKFDYFNYSPERCEK